MKRINELINNQTTYQDQEVEVGGWVKNIRESKKLNFIELNDGSTMSNIQLVIPNELLNGRTSFGSSLKVKGRFKLVDREHEREIKVEEITWQKNAGERVISVRGEKGIPKGQEIPTDDSWTTIQSIMAVEAQLQGRRKTWETKQPLKS